jgi:hypothetical protein
MNKVASELENFQPAQDNAPRNLLHELDVFASIDPLLGDLQRQYKDARFMRRMQEKQFGKDDPLGDVARDTEDSAWCSMQTRYLELRSDRDLMREVQAIQNEQREKEMRERDREKQRIALETYYRGELMTRMKQDAKSPSIFEWILWFMLIRRQQNMFSLAPSFSRLAA